MKIILDKAIVIPEGTELTRYGGNLRGLGYLTADKGIFIEDRIIGIYSDIKSDNKPLDLLSRLKDIVEGGQQPMSFWSDDVRKRKFEEIQKLIKEYDDDIQG